jgi:hypothetical protein
MATLIAAILFAGFLVYLCYTFLNRRKSRQLYTQLAFVLAVALPVLCR